MSDPFAPNAHYQLMREAQRGLAVVAVLLAILIYVAFNRITGRNNQTPEHIRNAPVAQTVWPYSNDSPFAEARRTANASNQSAIKATQNPTDELPVSLRDRDIDSRKLITESSSSVDDPRPWPKTKSKGATENKLRPLATATGNVDDGRSLEKFNTADLASQPIHAEYLAELEAPATSKLSQSAPFPHETQASPQAIVPAAIPTELPTEFQPALLHPIEIEQISSRNEPAPELVRSHSFEPKETPKESLPTRHAVVEGDSFYAIAQLYYEDGSFFRQLYQYNALQIEDFDALVPGTTIAIPRLADLEKIVAPRQPAFGMPLPNGDTSGPSLNAPQPTRPLSQTFASAWISDPSPPEKNLLNQVCNGQRKIRTQGGQTLFELAAEELGQASRYLEILALNRERLPVNFDIQSPLPENLELHLPRQ